jgi:hypothetical protein
MMDGKREEQGEKERQKSSRAIRKEFFKRCVPSQRDRRRH